MVDITGALAFIEQHGTPIHQALANFALGLIPSTDVITALAPHQTNNGCWINIHPQIAPDTPSIASTWQALQWLRWVSADNDPLVDRSAKFLATMQNPDGYWDELNTTDNGNRLFLTAAVCRVLMETGHDTEVYFGRALNYLANAWENGEVHSPTTPIGVTWMLMPLFKIAGQPSDQHIVEDCTMRLHNVLAEVDPLDAIGIAHAALITRYQATKLYRQACDYALTYQAADGGWQTRYGTHHRPNATVNALMLLRWGGLLS